MAIILWNCDSKPGLDGPRARPNSMRRVEGVGEDSKRTGIPILHEACRMGIAAALFRPIAYARRVT
ncbi:hypothetical protein A5892_17515 [Halotalea alkalilenta]|uniref:Uncharacterized protein n=1 Tax=Halotalea alkalilenta TaxID=376489 RepID=A0A172YIM3_9GAMM|nr:hypothetical protein A5892_17515 [Halotalea alkalilenta]